MSEEKKVETLPAVKPMAFDLGFLAGENDDENFYLQILDLTDPLTIGRRIGPAASGSKYNPVIHSKLCRCKLLGMSDSAAAKLCGISATTLKEWRGNYPLLESDMDKASAITQAVVTRLLMGTMNDDNPAKLNAIKFFLERRTDDFRQTQEVTLKSAGPDEVKAAVMSIYGIGGGNDESTTPNDGDEKLLQAPATGAAILDEL